MILQTGSPPGDQLVFCAETSTPRGSLALIRGNVVLAYKEWEKEASHSECIATYSKELLNQNSVNWTDIDVYGCGIGPGSFTGIRVAFNLIRSLSYFFKKPMLTATSFDLVLAPHLNESSNFLITQPAFRNFIYVMSVDLSCKEKKEVLPPSALTLEQIEEFILQTKKPIKVIGPQSEQLGDSLSQNALKKVVVSNTNTWPLAQSFSQLTTSNDFQTRPLDWKETRPLYIRASEAEEKLRLAPQVRL